MDRPSVALVGHEYPPYQIGGVGSYTRDLSYFLSERQVPTTVFCGRSKEPKEEYVNNHLTIVRLPFLDRPLRAYWFQLRNCSLLRNRLKHFDVVHAINPQASAVTLLARRKGTPLVTTIHGVPIFNTKAFLNTPVSDWAFYDFMYNFLEMPIDHMLHKMCVYNSEKIVVVGQNVLRQASVAFPMMPIDNVAVIPNGIDFRRLEYLKELSSGLRPVKGDYVLFYGRLVAVKGIPYLIKSIARLRAGFPALRLKIVGNGPLLGRLREMVAHLGLSGNVDFVGSLPNDEMMLTIMRSSFVVLPSTLEANSVSVLEAMACGKAVVAFDYSFTREMVQDFHTGLLAKGADHIDLAEKIELLLANEDLRDRLAANAFQRAYHDYNWDTLVDRYVQLYLEAANDGRCS